MNLEWHTQDNIAVSSLEFCTHLGKFTGEKSSFFMPGVEYKKTAPLTWLPSTIKQLKSDIKRTLFKTPKQVTGLMMNTQTDSMSAYAKCQERTTSLRLGRKK
ncbi:hypothetical protein GCG54_00015348 [Colletotrichum gloeosporioides]|uniref:Uncharacterized protein n=1 Tax=Colletotrichum gloeosporioides TaxID=474922 RepID=A0A8H4FEP5_COLGL|nr:uncharacterized protein GCG54_00015348 [Colletotrichum gloeosporioides]KAF3799160.1 hypothetical protein GCG54_00015348 [Colletotrichum gloeosporioides]